jgi:2-dehydro-3-deoxy-D-arabinonate dehydratase
LSRFELQAIDRREILVYEDSSALEQPWFSSTPKRRKTMRLIKFALLDDPAPRLGLLEADAIVALAAGASCLSALLHTEDIEAQILRLHEHSAGAFSLNAVRVLAPLDDQEVWGAGVTYERSKVARERESDQAATFYDRVYTAARPELFFKATASRVVGARQPIRVRRDSNWCVPEPELALVLNPRLEMVGLTIGNDVSARDIEGENPLYLPQAKVYDSCCALGPAITLPSAMPERMAIGIRMEIDRAGARIYVGETSIAKMRRDFEELIGWLGRDNRFPAGVVLLTGTGIVPPDDFSLKPGDVVRITIDGIGTLENPVVQTGPS